MLTIAFGLQQCGTLGLLKALVLHDCRKLPEVSQEVLITIVLDYGADDEIKNHEGKK
ncbi:MAG TPA: hypothetical protein PLT09_06870 [Deltaproteobacteria bacterium]|nr:hypothetical protein [Deltaproteobacteria bacterium]HPR53630.1 hypothetical protein [Deltaproteobacteria bacterium]HXK47145.1 hypothetical protein [Deltaproteobacteria bacterium]